jgi:hypothetical protein
MAGMASAPLAAIALTAATAIGKCIVVMSSLPVTAVRFRAPPIVGFVGRVISSAKR